MILSSIPHAASNFLAHMADAAGRSLILGCIAGLALYFSRVKSISLRLKVWRSVLGVALIMPLLGLFLPALSFKLSTQAVQRIEELRTASRVASAVVEAAQAPAQYQNFAAISQEGRADHSPANPIQGNGGQTVSAAIPAKESRLDSSPEQTISPAKNVSRSHAVAWLKSQLGVAPWMAILTATYLAVTLGFLFRFGLGLILSLGLERAASGIKDCQVLALLSKQACSAGIKRLPQLAESDLLSVPVTLGVFRPAILLPSGWRDWDEGELEAVITHEISHVARRDALVDRLSLLHRALFWFSPLSWYLTNCLAELAEEASDEAALAAGADRTHYAETLLGFFAELESNRGRVWWQGVAMATAGQAEKRLDRILEWKGSVTMQLKRPVVVLLVMTAIPLVYVAAALRPGAYNFHSTEYGQAQEQTPAPPPAPASQAEPPAAVSVAPVVSVSVLPKVAPLASVTPVVSVAPMPNVAPTTMVTPIHVLALAPLPVLVQSSHSGSTVIVRNEDSDSQQFVISSGNFYASVSGDSESYGTNHPSEFVEFLQEKIPGDFVWFRRDGKSYVIRDQAAIKRAKDFFAGVDALDKKQEELGRQQEALGRQQEALGKKQEGIRIQIPDMTEDLRKLEAELKALGTIGSEEDLGRIQEKIGDLQSKLGDLQSKAGEEQGKLGEQQGKLGEQQGKLGEQQGELGRQEEQIFKRASRQMKSLIDDAVAHGLANPE
jgi:beta-lactamase regulating signal transducer with metallopeptidase domain